MKQLVTHPLPRIPRIDADSNLSRPSRTRLRKAGIPVNRRPPGRRPGASEPKTKAGIWKKEQRERRRREAIRAIVIGAGTGRVGSTCLAANLQRQGFDVSHEAGNPASVDLRHGFRDRFQTSHMSPEKIDRIALDMLNILSSNPQCKPVVGDISWSNSIFAEAFLKYSKRVRVVFQTRPHLAFAKSHMQHHPSVHRWETMLLNDWGIWADAMPNREDRLATWSKKVLEFAEEVKDKYPDRVHIVALKDLNKFGQGFVKALGGTTPWDSACGTNASGMSRNELRAKRNHGQTVKATPLPKPKKQLRKGSLREGSLRKKRLRE